MVKPRVATLVLRAAPQSYRVQVRMSIEDARILTGDQKLAPGKRLEVAGGVLEYSRRSLHWESGQEPLAEQFVRRLIHHLHRYNMLMCERHDIRHADLDRPTCHHVLQRCFGEVRISRRTREGGTWKSRGSHTLCQLI